VIKKFLPLMILAVMLRVIVSLFLFHPDIKTINFQTSFLRDGVWDIYSYLEQNKAILPLKEEFVYFPFTYFSLGSYNVFLQTILGNGFVSWLFEAGDGVFNNNNVYLYLMAMKLPLLAFDLFIAFLITRLFSDKKEKENAFLLWLFNPFTILLIYAYSNIDLYTVAFVLLSFVLLKTNRLVLGSVVFGFGIAFKLYPLVFLPFFWLLGKNLKERLVIALIPIFVFLISIIPFFSKSFIDSALVSGLSTRLFYPNIDIGFGQSIIVSLSIFTFIFLYFFGKKKLNIISVYTLLMMTIYSFAHYHISWLLWISPFLIYLVVKSKDFYFPVFVYAIFAMFIPFLYPDRSMTVSLFRLFTPWFELVSTPFNIVSKFYDPYMLMSILHSMLLGVSLYIATLTIKKEEAL